MGAEDNTPGAYRLGEPIEKFVLELEDRMIRGHRDSRNREWAASVGVEGEKYTRIKADIQLSWRNEGRSKQDVEAKRDELRAKYREVFRVAMERENLGAAVRALEGLAKLDSLTQDVTLVQVSAESATITNRSRERVIELLDKAKDLAERRQRTLGGN